MQALRSNYALAVSPVAFATDALGLTPDPWQGRVLRWTGKRLLMNCARQSGKSTTSAILALHRAIYQPGSLILLISPSLRQSSELFRKVVDFMHRLADLPALVEDNRLCIQFQGVSVAGEPEAVTLSQEGSRIVSLPSNEATIRGFSSPALIIEDEASRVDDELHLAMRPMLAVSGGALVLMSTPYGKRGHFYEEWERGGSDWERVMVKATECPRISPAFLDAEARSLGDHFFSQEYLCEFRDTTDQIFSSNLIANALSNDVKPLFENL